MPQFEFATVFWPQFVWLAVFFAVLYFGVILPTVPKIGRTMQAREDQVGGDIAAAEEAKRRADELDEQHRTELAAAREQARAVLAESKTRANRATEAKLAEAQGAADARIVEAEARLDEQRRAALVELRTVAGESARDIVTRLTGRTPEPAAAQAAAARALEQVG